MLYFISGFVEQHVVALAEAAAQQLAQQGHIVVGEVDGLRKYRSRGRAAYPMQGLIPPAIGWNAEARNSGALVEQLLRFFFQRELRQQVVDASLQGLRWVAKGGRRLCLDSKT